MIEPCADHEHPHCTGCDRPMRKRTTKLDDHPGTIAQRRTGICNSCGWAQQQGREASNLGPKFIVGTPCTVCKRPMRPKRTLLVDAPGTIEGYSRLICKTDRARYIKAGKQIPTEATILDGQDKATTTTVTALDSYLASRRQRGIPPTGLRKSA